jgi:hypothetical protein
VKDHERTSHDNLVQVLKCHLKVLPSGRTCSLLRCSSFTTSVVLLNSLLNANDVPSSPIVATLKKEAIRSSEISILTRATQHNIAEDCILHSHRLQSLKSYIALTGWAL